MKSKKVRKVFVSKYGKSGKNEDRSSKKKGMHLFRHMATALASETSRWICPALKGEAQQGNIQSPFL